MSTHTRPQTLRNTRSAWQGHLPAQDTPISVLPLLDHGPTHCVTPIHTHKHMHSNSQPYWVTSFICLPTGGAGEHLLQLIQNTYSKRADHCSNHSNHRQTEERLPQECVPHQLQVKLNEGKQPTQMHIFEVLDVYFCCFLKHTFAIYFKKSFRCLDKQNMSLGD